MAAKSLPQLQAQQDSDNFSLYNLKVEVMCPPDKRILCGAKVGDFFTLEGEMLYLPPGQGISIYSLGKAFWPREIHKLEV
jgi:hypothetical protein